MFEAQQQGLCVQELTMFQVIDGIQVGFVWTNYSPSSGHQVLLSSGELYRTGRYSIPPELP